MPRNMSFAMTTRQFIDQSKTVTRRFGWGFLKPGDIVCGVKKAMGLKAGESIERLGLIRIISTRWEPLNQITADDVIREGFPDWSPDQFVDMLVRHYKIQPNKPVNRIEFEHLPPLNEEQLEFDFIFPINPLKDLHRSAHR
jgi:hypothetical protein